MALFRSLESRHMRILPFFLGTITIELIQGEGDNSMSCFSCSSRASLTLTLLNRNWHAARYMLDWVNCWLMLMWCSPVNFPTPSLKTSGYFLIIKLSFVSRPRVSCFECCAVRRINLSIFVFRFVQFVIVRVFNYVHANTRFSVK